MLWIVVFAFVVVLAVILDALLKLLRLKPHLAAEGSGFHGDSSLQPSKPELAETATNVSTEAQRSGFHDVLSSPQSNPDLPASVAAVNAEAQGSDFQFDLLPPSGCKYDVFLSFHGPDTRQGFTDCLYQALKGAGVCTLWDDERIRIGDKINSETLQAIAESKIVVPILSRNYASSKRCLKELACMLECKENGKNMILPIFYDVTPTEVQDQTGDYGIHLQKHEEKYGPETVKQWKGALAEVGHLKGMNLVKSVNGYEGKLIMLTVSEVLSELKKAQQIESESSARIDDCVKFVQLRKPNIEAVAADVYLEAQELTSYSHPSPPTEVFLSYWGPRIRFGFTEHLYHALKDAGVCTYPDNKELPYREIDDNLLKAISESKISIPIISENYASSKQCLRELTLMLQQRKEEKSHVILPVFHCLNPRDFRNQTGNYARLLQAHDKYDIKIVQQCREALRLAGSMMGIWLGIEDENERHLVELIVSTVLSKLNSARLLVAKKENSVHLLSITSDVVAIDDHVEDVKQLLQLGENEVKILGIWGTGGIGKTTLAKAIYNQIMNDFECCSFIGDIREKSRSKGIEYLQSSLVADLSRCGQPFFKNVDEGIRQLKDTYRGKKVLILLDGIDDTKELDALLIRHNSFGPGSRIMITTRNRLVLGRVDCIHETTLLNQDAALKLFCKHAFGKDTAIDLLFHVSRDIVSAVGGLPLALKAVGSFLSVRIGMEPWEEMLRKLVTGCCGVVQDKLRKHIFEELDHKEKQIFLDIACFFVGEDIRNVSPIWKYQFPKIVDVLIAKSIIKIGDDHKIWMYDQLRNLGREIVRQENDKEPGKRSRLWRTDEAKYVLENNMGSSNVEAIRITHNVINREECCFTSEQFTNLSRLRFLDLDAHAHFAGDFGNLLPSLQWLRWTDSLFNSLFNLHLPNLVCLVLDGVQLRDDWKGWGSIKMMKLKVLNLTSSQNLERTPDFSAFPHLERLNLSHGSNLKVIDPSLTELKKLTFLDISFCPNIKELPENLGCLDKLEIFNASECTKLARFPDSIGQLSSLIDLTVDGTFIRELPDSIECLHRLQRLSLRRCRVLKVLPDIGCLCNLQTLNLYDCRGLETLRALPGSQDVDNNANLITLDISYTRVKSLPSLSNLKLLKTLNACGCDELKELDGLNQLNALESLDISDCSAVTKLPDLSNLKLLKDVCISGCGQLKELSGLHQLYALERLDASACCAIKRLTNFSNFALSEQLHALKKLNISSCTEIERTLDLSIFKQLESLCANGCGKLHELLGLDELKSLKILKISDCKEIEYLPDLSKLKQLKELYANGCEKLQDLMGLDELESLVYLAISNCKLLEDLPDLSRLKQLQELDATGCEKLRELVGLGELDALKRLMVSGCKEMEKLPGLSKLNRLIEFNAKGCYKLEELEGLDKLDVSKSLDISLYGTTKEVPDDWTKKKTLA